MDSWYIKERDLGRDKTKWAYGPFADLPAAADQLMNIVVRQTQSVEHGLLYQSDLELTSFELTFDSHDNVADWTTGGLVFSPTTIQVR